MHGVDSPTLQPVAAADQGQWSRQRPGRRRGILLLLVSVGLSAAGGYLWFRSQERLVAAEAAARSQIQALGGLLLSGDAGKHVGSLNLSLIRDQESFDRAMVLVSDLRWLQVLDLTETSVTAEQLSKLTHLRQLQSLHLAKTRIGDAAVAEIAKLPSLSALHASGTNLTNESLEHIGEISTLSVLDLSATKIDGDFAPLRGLKKLAWLVLRNVPIDDAAIDTLSLLPLLNRLTVEKGQITEQQWRRLRRQKQGIKVDGTDVED